MPEEMEWAKVASGLFYFGWSVLGVAVVTILRDMSASVKELNVNVAIVIERVAGHEKRIEKLEDRL